MSNGEKKKKIPFLGYVSDIGAEKSGLYAPLFFFVISNIPRRMIPGRTRRMMIIGVPELDDTRLRLSDRARCTLQYWMFCARIIYQFWWARPPQHHQFTIVSTCTINTYIYTCIRVVKTGDEHKSWRRLSLHARAA